MNHRISSYAILLQYNYNLLFTFYLIIVFGEGKNSFSLLELRLSDKFTIAAGYIIFNFFFVFINFGNVNARL